jgi:hypothetical protein
MTTTGKQAKRASRERRLDAALRENLKRRKAQARRRQAVTEGEGEPPADQAASATPEREPPAGEPDKS